MCTQCLPDDSHRVLHDGDWRDQHEQDNLSQGRRNVRPEYLVLPDSYTRLHCPLRAAEPRPEPPLPNCVSNPGKYFFAFLCTSDAAARADVPLDHLQPLSPLLVIMRVAQHRHLNRDGVVVTTDELLSASAPHRPRLTLKLDFKPRDSSDIEEAESWCETAMVPVSPELPGPLPFVRIKSGPPSAIEMLDSEKMDGLWKSQDSRRASWLISPPPSAPIYLSSCTSSRDDLRAEKFPLHDRPVVEDASNIPYYPPTPPPSDTFYSPSNLSYLPM